MDTLVLTAKIATPETTAPFGFWLGTDAPGPIRSSGFYGGKGFILRTGAPALRWQNSANRVD